MEFCKSENYSEFLNQMEGHYIFGKSFGGEFPTISRGLLGSMSLRGSKN